MPRNTLANSSIIRSGSIGLLLGLSALLAPPAHAVEDDDRWFDGFDAGNAPGNTVEALVQTEDGIAAGGWFTDAGGNSTNYVAVWDGTGWYPYGAGFDGRVYDLAVWNGQLIAAGAFYKSANTVLKSIGRWDGHAWQPMGAGFLADVVSLAVYKGELYCGGYFDEPGPNGYRHMAKWNGSEWVPVGLIGPDEAVYDMQVWDGKLVIGGTFTHVDGIEALRLATWDGQNWSTLGGGVDNYVHSLTTFRDDLIVSGRFLHAGGTAYNRIVRRANGQWHSMGQGLDNRAYGLDSVNDDYLIAGGSFLHAGGVEANRVALWNGTTWEPIGSGTSSPVSEVLAVGLSVYFGGTFSQAGGNSSLFIARWDALPAAAVPTPTAQWTVLAPEPNPMTESTLLRWHSNASGAPLLRLFDASGRQVIELAPTTSGAGLHETRWTGRDASGSRVPAGIYWARAENAPAGTAQRIILIR